MTKLRDYRAWKLRKLANPRFAAHYLNEIEHSSPELILSAIQNVVRARDVSTVAKEAGVARENIYRAFTEQGNPTFTTFWEVLKAVGVKFHFEPIETTSSLASPLQLSIPAGLGNPDKPEQSKRGMLGSLGEGKVLAVPYMAHAMGDESDFLGESGQQAMALRRYYGREQEANQAIQ
jgi:probable addiction module antidote protein